MRTITIVITTILLLGFSEFQAQDLIDRTRLEIESDYEGVPTRIYNELHSNEVLQKIDLFNYKSYNPKIELTQEMRNKSVFLSLNQSRLDEIIAVGENSFEINIPVDEENYFELVFRRFNCLSETFQATNNAGDVIVHSGIYAYRGYLKSDPSSHASMTVSGDNVALVIADYSGNYNLGSFNSSTDTYVLFNEVILNQTPFVCGVQDDFEDFQKEIEASETRRMTAVGCIDIYLELDHDLYLASGGTEASIFNTIFLFNESATIFFNEDVDITISDLIVWTTPDPYSEGSSSAALNDFIDEVGTSFDGDLAHLIASDGGNGGLAQIDYGEFKNNAKAYSDIGSFNNVAFPNYTWQVQVFTHELGHNMGSPHTHSCWWSTGAIDNCYCPEGSCSFGPEPPSTGGTTMSYCHLLNAGLFNGCNIPTSNPGISFTAGFGTLPGNTIRTGITNAINSNIIDGDCSCSVPCGEDYVLAAYGWSYPGNWSYLAPRTFGDVNGDGKDDVIGFASVEVRVSLSTGDDIVYDNTWDLPHFGLGAGGWNTNIHIREVIDLNNDGLGDIVGFGNAAVYVSTSTGTGFNDPVNWTPGYGSNNGFTIDDHPRLFGDFNNDNLNDFVAFANAITVVEESTGTSFEKNTDFDLVHFHNNQGWTGLTPRLVGDVDGDGYDDDVVGFGISDVEVVTSDGSTFSSVDSWTTNFTSDEGWSTNFHIRQLADVNGDGMDDVVGFAHEGVRVGISTGSSFEEQELWISNFGPNNGWTIDNHPRYVTDVNNDGMADIIGFANAGVYVSYSNGTSFDPLVLISSCYGFNDNWSDVDYVRAHADFTGNGEQQVVAMGCGGTYIMFEQNDDCSSAYALTTANDCVNFVDDNISSTASGELPDFSCGLIGTTIDVWFTTEVPSSGEITIETSEVTGGLTDMVMQVLSGSCGSLTEVECDDDDGSGYHSLVNLTGRSPGEILYVRVIDYNSNNFGEFNICAYGPGDLCPSDFAGPNQLTGLQNSDADFESSGLIQSDQCINANVDYDSATEVELLEGFEVKLGNIFEAFIDGCGNLFSGNADDSGN